MSIYRICPFPEMRFFLIQHRIKYFFIYFQQTTSIRPPTVSSVELPTTHSSLWTQLVQVDSSVSSRTAWKITASVGPSTIPTFSALAQSHSSSQLKSSTTSFQSTQTGSYISSVQTEASPTTETQPSNFASGAALLPLQIAGLVVGLLLLVFLFGAAFCCFRVSI